MKFERIENIALAFTAVFSILLGGAAVVSIVILAGLLSEFAVVPLHAQTSPAVELQAAMTKEQVDGDLKTAIWRAATRSWGSRRRMYISRLCAISPTNPRLRRHALGWRR